VELIMDKKQYLELFLKLSYKFKSSESIVLYDNFKDINSLLKMDLHLNKYLLSLKAINYLHTIIENGIDDELNEKIEYVHLKCSENKIDIVNFFDKAYPNSLRGIQNPPSLIFTKGDKKQLNNKNIVAIIGTRNASSAGISLANQLSIKLAEKKYVILSGLAKGIDTVSHNAALSVKGSTIAVLPTSVLENEIYPKENRGLSNIILEKSGVLISEYPPGTPPLKQNMIARNRLQSGISNVVIGIEFDVTSGTMHTINFAIKQNKLIAIPNNTTLVTSQVIDQINNHIDYLFDSDSNTLIQDLVNLNHKQESKKTNEQLKFDL